MHSGELRHFFDGCPPFTHLTEEERSAVFATTHPVNARENQVIFRQGEAPADDFYLVVSGAIRLTELVDGQEETVDICERGAIFGVKARLGGRNYIYTAMAFEPTELLAIAFSSFQPLMESKAEVALFFAAGFASGKYQNLEMKRVDEARRLFRPKRHSGFLLETETIPASSIRRPLTCSPETSIREASRLMTERRMGSMIVVNEDRCPIGIVTDLDFRVKVGGGDVTADAPISLIMSSPVLTMADTTTVAALTLRMMRGGIRHVCLTADGTDRTPVVGVLSEHDVLLTNDHNPAVIVRDLLAAEDASTMRRLMDRSENLVHLYLQQEISPGFISEIVSDINDALVTRAIDLARNALRAEGWTEPAVPWAWLSLGSEGRREQLLRTDQDNALLFDDVAAAELEPVRAAFLQLATRVVDILVECGFARCPGNIMASNPDLCQPLSVWQKRFASWIFVPEAEALLNAAIFFDLRCSAGNQALADHLKAFVREKAREGKMFLRFLAKDAVRTQPPLGFFRNLLVEKSGEHKNQLDLKLRGLLPLNSAARVLALETAFDGPGTTHNRLLFAATKLPSMSDSIREAAAAYPLLLRLRTLNALEHPERKNHINPEELSRLERQALKNAFQIVDALQKDLRGAYHLDQLV